MFRDVKIDTVATYERPVGRRLTGVALCVGLLVVGACEQSDGGCEPFREYAQNVWDPIGAGVRAKPDVLAERLEPGFAGNEVVAVDGWVDTGEPAYPDNTEPWNSGIWYRLANRDGWVAYAALRDTPTSPDPSHGFAEDGGQPPQTPAQCELDV